MKLVTKIIEFFRARDLKRGYTCDGCGGEIFDYPNKKLCDECESLLERNDKFSCEKCGRKSVTAGVCMLCKREVPKFTRGFSPFVYRGKAASLLNAMNKNHLEPKCMVFVHSDEDAEPSMVLVSAIKGGAEGLKILPPLFLNEKISDGEKGSARKMTARAQKIYDTMSFGE